MMSRPLWNACVAYPTWMLLLLLLAGCSEPNPLLGHWEYDKEESKGLAAAGAEISAKLSGVEQIEFREDKVVSGGKSESVTYEVTEDRVIVTGLDGEGEVYTIVDENRVILDRSTGRIALKRVLPSVAAPTPTPTPTPASESEPE